MDVDGAPWVPLSQQSSRAATGPARTEGRKNRFWNRGMRVLRLVGCWEAELGEIPSSYSGFLSFSYTHVSVCVITSTNYTRVVSTQV